jgi:hypothetical protein
MTDDTTVYAYPVPLTNRGRGMTLRDQFATSALAGLTSLRSGDGDTLMGWAEIAEEAYAIADAMLAERQKPHA